MKSCFHFLAFLSCMIYLSGCASSLGSTPILPIATASLTDERLPVAETASPMVELTSTPIPTQTPLPTTSLPTSTIYNGLLGGLGWEMAVDDTGLNLIDLNTGTSNRLTQTTFSMFPATFAVSPSGDRILYAEFNPESSRIDHFTLLNRRNGDQTILNDLPENSVPYAAWHPGGEFFVIGNLLYDASTGQRLAQIGGELIILGPSFSQDGKHLSMVIAGQSVMLLSDLALDTNGRATGEITRNRLCGLGYSALNCLDRTNAVITQEDYDQLYAADFRQLNAARWSPQEDFLAVLSEDNLYLLNPDGTFKDNLTNDFLPQMGLTEMGWTPEWSPDGSRIAFSAIPPGGGLSRVFVASADGSGVIEITGAPYPNGQSPAWTPDSRYLLYSGLSETGQGVVLADPDGSRRTLLNDQILGGAVILRYKARPSACPGSLPSGLEVNNPGVVTNDPPLANRVRDEASKDAVLRGQMAPGEEFTVLEGPLCAEGWNWWRVRSTSQDLEGWSSDGDGKDLWLAPVFPDLLAGLANSTDETEPTLSPAFQGSGSNPALALQGKGYQIGLSSEVFSIYDVDSRQTNQLPLQNAVLNSLGCWSWSPDGSKLLYGTTVRLSNDKAVVQPRVLDFSTGRFTNLPPTLTCDMTWHPNSRAVLLGSALQVPMDEINSPLFPILVNSQDGRPITRLPVSGINRVSFSPDGRRLAFSMGWENRFYLLEIIVNPEGQVVAVGPRPESVHVNFSDYYVEQIYWSPDGDRLAIQAMISDDQKMQFELYLVDPDGRNLRSLTQGLLEKEGISANLYGNPWSPDGSRLAFIGVRYKPLDDGGWTWDFSRVFVADASNGKLTEMTGAETPRGTHPLCWSPDGAVLTFRNYPTSYQVAAWPDGSGSMEINPPMYGWECAFRPGPAGQPLVIPTSEPAVVLPLPTLPAFLDQSIFSTKTAMPTFTPRIIAATPTSTTRPAVTKNPFPTFTPRLIPTQPPGTRTATTRPTSTRTATTRSTPTKTPTIRPTQADPAEQNSTWSKLLANAPFAQRGAQAVYDSVRKVVVLFGGEGRTILQETWEFDGKTWKKVITAKSPPARIWHAMAYDAQRKVVVLYGGENGSVKYGDTWEYDGLGWRQITTANSPGQRSYGPGMAYDSCRKKVVLFGGDNSTSTWEYDGVNWTQVKTASSPPARGLTAMAFDSARCRTVIFAGNGSMELSDTWEFDGKTWLKMGFYQSPSSRWGHALAYDPVHQVVVLFGGYHPSSTSGKTLGDTWLYDSAGWRQVTLSTSPSAREQHCLAFDPLNNGVILYGGFGATDTWRLTLVGPK